MIPGRARVLISPDSFKGSAGAAEAGAAIARGWCAERPGDRVRVLPMADGGEGTLDALETALPGASRVPVRAPGPDGAPREASWLRVPTPAGAIGVVELAETSGIALLARPLPDDADTRGCGLAIAAALEAGVRELVIAIGGSCSTDGGAGLLAALGARLLDGSGSPIQSGNRGLHALERAEFRGLAAAPPGGVRVLADVRNPLLGPAGAAAVFGEQKGAHTAASRARLEAGLARLAAVSARARPSAPSLAAAPGAGAAGGAGFGLSLWGARIVPGAAVIAQLVGLGAEIARADLVITGEGRYDAQSAGGKAPWLVAAEARAAGVPVALVAGGLADPAHGFAAVAELSALAGSAGEAMRAPARWLEAAGAQLARRLGG